MEHDKSSKMATFYVCSKTKKPFKLDFDCIVPKVVPKSLDFSQIRETRLYKDVLSYSLRNFKCLKYTKNESYFENMVHSMAIHGTCTLYWEENYEKLLLHTLFYVWWFTLDDCLDHAVFASPALCKKIVNIVANIEQGNDDNNNTVNESFDDEILEIGKANTEKVFEIFASAFKDIRALLEKQVPNFDINKERFIQRFRTYVEFGVSAMDGEEYRNISFDTFLHLKGWIVGVAGSYELCMMVENINLDEEIWENQSLQDVVKLSTMKSAIRNDLIGLQKDREMGENINSIIHTMKLHNNMTEEKAIIKVMQRHNELVSDYVYLKGKVLKRFKSHPNLPELNKYIEMMERYEWGSILFQLNAPRYRLEGSFQFLDLKLRDLS